MQIWIEDFRLKQITGIDMGKEQWAEQRDHMRAMVEQRDRDGWESPEVEQWARFFLYSLEAAVKKELPEGMMEALRKYADNLEKALAAATGEREMLMLKAGDRVHHIGRLEDGTVLPFVSTGVVRVEFDNPAPSGKPSIGEFTEAWFKRHPNWLRQIPESSTQE